MFGVSKCLGLGFRVKGLGSFQDIVSIFSFHVLALPYGPE